MGELLQKENEQISKFYKKRCEAIWMVNTTGSKEWQEKEVQYESEHRSYCSDPERFDLIKKKLDQFTEGSLERRQYERLYQEALENQISPDMLKQMVQFSSQLSNVFNTFRAEVEGEKWTENQVRELLLTSSDEKLREKVWKASKEIGKYIAPDLLKLVRLRNQAARQLGYEDYHQMMFELQELDRDVVFQIFDQLKTLTDEPFRKIKAEIDQELRNQCGLSEKATLYPWHYQDLFFQEAPAVAGSDLSPYLKGRNIEKLTVDTFEPLGLEIRDMLAQSDLYERENKNQHAFCMNMDREGDVRVLCNIRDNQYWTATMLHEYGHAVYDKYVDRELPFLLRGHTHIFATEAVAMFFGRFVLTRDWLSTILKLDDLTLEKILPGVEQTQQRQLLILARWVITFVNFEREMYRDPDQDLNRLWWKFVQEIQMVQPPTETDFPHWASKIHFTIAPAYYQNYLLGELTASQFDQYIMKNISNTYFDQAVGTWFKEKVFFPGDRYGWSKWIQEATNEPLNPEHFVNQFVK